MTKRILIYSLTILSAIPAFLFVAMLPMYYHFTLTDLFVVEEIITAGSCCVGGVLLWRKHKWGYPLSTLAWLLIIFGGICGVNAAFDPRIKEPMRSYMIVQSGIFFVIGIPVFLILVRHILKDKEIVQHISHTDSA